MDPYIVLNWTCRDFIDIIILFIYHRGSSLSESEHFQKLNPFAQQS